MPSSFENLPPNREHADDSAVAEAVRRELQKRGERTPEMTDLAEMLDPEDIKTYATEEDEGRKKKILEKLIGDVLEKEAHF